MEGGGRRWMACVLERVVYEINFSVVTCNQPPSRGSLPVMDPMLHTTSGSSDAERLKMVIMARCSDKEFNAYVIVPSN